MKPAVLLLHGFPFNSSMWREQVEFLGAQGYPTGAPELNRKVVTPSGQEYSPALRTMDEMARDVAALMDRSRIDRAVICGLSMGGYVALEFAQQFPQRVRALVLAGTRAPADSDQEKAAREQQVETMLRAGMVPISVATVPKLLAPTTVSAKPDVVKRVREMVTGTHPLVAAAAQRGMAARRSYVSDLPAIEVPALIIVGREDPIRPVADSEFLHERIRNSQLLVIEDAAHLTNMEQPEEFNQAVLGFLQQLSEAQP